MRNQIRSRSSSAVNVSFTIISPKFSSVIRGIRSSQGDRPPRATASDMFTPSFPNSEAMGPDVSSLSTIPGCFPPVAVASAACAAGSKVYAGSGDEACSAAGAFWPGDHPAEKYWACADAAHRRELKSIPESFMAPSSVSTGVTRLKAVGEKAERWTKMREESKKRACAYA